MRHHSREVCYGPVVNTLERLKGGFNESVQPDFLSLAMMGLIMRGCKKVQMYLHSQLSSDNGIEGLFCSSGKGVREEDERFLKSCRLFLVMQSSFLLMLFLVRLPSHLFCAVRYSFQDRS